MDESGPPASQAARTPDPSPQSSPVVSEAEVYLSGPFGTLDGLVAADGHWPDASEFRPLDQLVESAPLDVGMRDADIGISAWAARIAPSVDPSDEAASLTATGPEPGARTDLFSINGPSAGDMILRVDLSLQDGSAGAYHWRLLVPDLPLPADGIIDTPPPDLRVTAADDGIPASLGSHCHVYACGDIPRPLITRLPTLEAPAADDLQLALSDASGFTHWTVTALPSSDSKDASAEEIARGSDLAGVTGVAIPAPNAGDWLITVQVTYDLERGNGTYYFRLVTH